MLPELLHHSVTSTEGSSGGRSALNLRMSFEQGMGGLRHEFQVLQDGTLRWVATFETTVASPADLWREVIHDSGPGSELIRILCYYLVSQIPEQGLKEAAREINEIRLFHTVNPPTLPASRALEAHSGAVLATRSRGQLTLEEES